MSTVFQKESGSCTGRGFGAGEFLGKFLIWVVKAPGAGGPQWYLWDDQSGLGTDPYVVVCDTAAPTVNDYNTGPSGGAPKFLKVGFLTSEAAFARVQNYMWWDNGTQTGYGLWGGTRVATVDAGTFAYDFRGGAECMMISSIIGTDIDMSVIDEFEGIPNLLEAASVVAVIPGLTSPGSSVVVPMSGGDEALFTANKFYYIYNFNGEHHVEYVKVTAIGAGSITIETITASFAAGSVIGAYPHRYYNFGNGGPATPLNRNSAKIPYCSAAPGYVFHDQTSIIEGGIGITSTEHPLARINPGDDGLYSGQRFGIVEYYREQDLWNGTGMNRMYGQSKNLYIAYNNSYAALLDGINIVTTSKEYLKFVHAGLFIAGNGVFDVFVLNTDSLV